MSATINSSTFAGNTGQATASFGVPSGTRLDAFGLIVWGNDGADLVGGEGDVTIDCSILQTLFPGSDNLVADPDFLDPANGNYHISRNSPAVDYCNGGSPVDIDLESRPKDVEGVGFLFDSTDASRGDLFLLAIQHSLRGPAGGGRQRLWRRGIGPSGGCLAGQHHVVSGVRAKRRGCPSRGGQAVRTGARL